MHSVWGVRGAGWGGGRILGAVGSQPLVGFGAGHVQLEGQRRDSREADRGWTRGGTQSSAGGIAHVCSAASVLSGSAALWTVACQAPLSTDFPGKNAGVGCHALLQGIFPTHGLNPGPALQADSLPAEPPGKPISHYYFVLLSYH